MEHNKLAEVRPETSALIVVDIQDRLFRVMSDRDDMLEQSIKVISGIKKLKIPIIITEQYPKGIGQTLAPIIEALGDDYKPIEKVEFSCLANEEFSKTLTKLKYVTDLFVIGIEAHVCIFQTVLDAIKGGYTVHLLTDAVSSRSKLNREIGINRCEKMGAYLSSVEMILFQLLKKAGTPEFKEISRIVK